jgi:hypothetical protein
MGRPVRHHNSGLLHRGTVSPSCALGHDGYGVTTRERSSEMEMILNPWVFGLEAVQQGWQAQIALAFRLMQSFVPDQTTSPLSPDAVADDIKAPEAIAAIADVRKAPAPIIDRQRAPAAIADVRRRKAPKGLRASKKTSRVKATSKMTSRAKAKSVSKRAAAASQNSARKAVHRSPRKPR